MKKTATWLFMAVLAGSAFGANYSYNGLSTNNVNDWYDADNWTPLSDTNYPVAGDNALFTVNGKSMVISQVVPVHSQFQVGRGNATTNVATVIVNSATIVAGGVVTNSNQTIAGIQNKGRGTLVVDGGSLVTKQIQINVAGTVGHVPDPASIMQVKSGSVEVSGNVLLGVTTAGTLEISGGSTAVGGDLRFTEGTLRIIGDAGSLNITTNFAWGTAAAKSTKASFVLGGAGGVSTIYADTYSKNGTQSLVIDGSLATVGSVVNLTLIDLANDTFSAAEFAALTNGLSLVHMADGALSLNVSSNQLLFTGTPIPQKLVKGWEFNTPGDTEEFLSTTANSHIVGITVTNAINGSESVLTSSDITGNDPQLFYNQNNADPALFIPAGGGAWRTLEIRVRQLNANPGEGGVASKAWDLGGTVMITTPGANLGGIQSGNTNMVSYEAQADNWVVATFNISTTGTNDLKNLRVDPIGGNAGTNFNFEVDYIRVYADDLNWGVSEPATIIGAKAVAGGLVELTIHAPTPSTTYPKSKTNLVFDPSWTPAPHAASTGGPFVVSNLTYATASGTNLVIYLQADASAEFFGTGPQ